MCSFLLSTVSRCERLETPAYRRNEKLNLPAAERATAQSR